MYEINDFFLRFGSYLMKYLKCWHLKMKFKIIYIPYTKRCILWNWSLANPGLSWVGSANSQSRCANLIFCKFFCRKLHEYERISTLGGRASLAPNLDPTKQMALSHINAALLSISRSVDIYIVEIYYFENIKTHIRPYH